MDSVYHIDPQSWVMAPDTVALMDVLNKGGRQESLFVGGSVRNAVLQIPVSDVDIATVLSPDAVMTRLRDHGIQVVPLSLEHGTVMAVMNDRTFEITTLRKDIETDGRHAVVAFTDNWIEDARRRDFTMNTLLMDMQGRVYDPLGAGVKDLQDRRVAFVGDPAARIAEDYLRVLRFFRFYAYYGQGAIDQAALQACYDAADKLDLLSKERITQEFLKILLCDNPADILDLMFEGGVLDVLHSEEYEAENLQRLCEAQSRLPDCFAGDTISSRFMSLCAYSTDHLKRLYDVLIIPKLVRKQITSIQNAIDFPKMINDHAVRVAVYRHGRNVTAQALAIEQSCGHVPDRFFDQALDVIEHWDIPVFPISGAGLLARGDKPGPALGEKLKKMEQDWIDNGFKAT